MVYALPALFSLTLTMVPHTGGRGPDHCQSTCHQETCDQCVHWSTSGAELGSTTLTLGWFPPSVWQPQIVDRLVGASVENRLSPAFVGCEGPQRVNDGRRERL